MRISIIGSGIIGQATGIGFSAKGSDVLFYDIDKQKLRVLKEKGCSVVEELEHAIDTSEVAFICVPTPTSNGTMDFSFLKSASADVGKALKKSKTYHVITIRSTVLPSTTRSKVIPILERYSGLKAGKDFGVCMNPEFLREKSPLQDFLNPSRIVIGELDNRSGEKLEALYTPFNAPIFRLDLDSAEMVKYVSNLFLGSKISFFNEIFLVCKELKLNDKLISKIVALDPRIGEYGVYGGRPFEGSCLPKDLRAFVSFVKDREINPKLLEEVLRINEKMRAICAKSGKSS